MFILTDKDCVTVNVLTNQSHPFFVFLNTSALNLYRRLILISNYLQACLSFLREKTLLEARMAGQRQGPVPSLVLETTQVFFKVGYVLLFILESIF